MIKHQSISLSAKPRGFHLITDEIIQKLNIDSSKDCLVHLLLQHTSASLSINENADPSVRKDCLKFINKWIPESDEFEHSMEGADDMPAHIKSMTLGIELTLPVSGGNFMLGMWQGIYLGEHRNNAGVRNIVASIIY